MSSALTENQQSAQLLDLQSPVGVPLPATLNQVTDPLNPPTRTADVLAHFYDALYDKSASSHLSRFLKVLLGDAGVGQLRKRYVVARFSQVLAPTRYDDQDRFYSVVLGLRRFVRETLDLSPYLDVGTPAEWDAQDAKDSSYRARIEQFSRALAMGGTKMGMEAAASAILGDTQCQIYETYFLVDENGGNPGGSPPPVNARDYGDVELDYRYYGSMQRGTYADIEGGSGSIGRTTSTNRSEFVVRPQRQISLEEYYEMIRVLSRIKPAEALLTVDANGVEIHSPVSLRAVAADSTYWEVAAKVSPKPAVAGAYSYTRSTDPNHIVAPVAHGELPRPVFTGYQGEAWSYNSDVATVSSYSEDGVSHALIGTYDYERLIRSGAEIDFTADKAIEDPTQILLGRNASDGVLVSAPYSPSRVGTNL